MYDNTINMFQIMSLESSHHLTAVAFVLVVVSVALFLCMFKTQRGALVGYLLSWMPKMPQEWSISSAKTPTRSASPKQKISTRFPSLGDDKGLSAEVKRHSSPPAAVDHTHMFPPSRRESVAILASKLPRAQRQRIRGGEVDEAEFRNGLIPMTGDYRKCGPSTYTPTRISMAEISALQDFPDYAELSGVPLPKAYKEFRIETALPRPYRPFRWAYHQTMCIYLPFPLIFPKSLTLSDSANQTRARLVAGA